MSPGEQNFPWWRTTDLNDASMTWRVEGKDVCVGFIKKPEKAIWCFIFPVTSCHLISPFFFNKPRFLDSLMSLHEGNSKILFENEPNWYIVHRTDEVNHLRMRPVSKVFYTNPVSPVQWCRRQGCKVIVAQFLET